MPQAPRGGTLVNEVRRFCAGHGMMPKRNGLGKDLVVRLMHARARGQPSPEEIAELGSMTTELDSITTKPNSIKEVAEFVREHSEMPNRWGNWMHPHGHSFLPIKL